LTAQFRSLKKEISESCEQIWVEKNLQNGDQWH